MEDIIEKILNGENFTFKGQLYTFDSFKKKFIKEELDADSTRNLIAIFVRKGAFKIVDNQTDEEKLFESIMSEETIKNVADTIEDEEEMIKDYKANKKREGKLKYPEISIDFATYTLAYKAQLSLIKTLRLEETEIQSGNPGEPVKLIIKNVTESELSYINKYYMATKAMDYLLDTTTKVAEATTKGVAICAKDIATPVAKIGINAGVSVAKTASHVLLKTGATAITSSTKALKELKEDVCTDTEIIKATRDLIGLKDIFKRKFGFNSKTTRGINIIK